ncbi:MAG TPA: nuclear transport factor 2 family protein [Alphaproteobacteria bacterium]|nr:nuclear transport factor 2 family protein [Alphaproteobacteria bacterium]
MRKEIGQEENGLQALLAREAIRELVGSYSRGVDRQDFALLRSLYTPEAIEDDHGGAYSGSAEGYVDWLERVMVRVENSAHLVHSHLIALEGSERAQGEVYVSGHSRLRLEEGGFEDLTHGMRYLDHYAKWNGRWLFARRTVIVDWLTAGPTQWAPERPDTRDAAFGRPGSADPSYRVLGHPFFARR